MPSFDIVSEINMEEVRNATENASRELSTRFDFRGVEASFEYKEKTVVRQKKPENFDQRGRIKHEINFLEASRSHR